MMIMIMMMIFIIVVAIMNNYNNNSFRGGAKDNGIACAMHITSVKRMQTLTFKHSDKKKSHQV